MPRASTTKTLRNLGLTFLLAALAAPGARAGGPEFDDAAEPSPVSFDAGGDAAPNMGLEAVPALVDPLSAQAWTPSAAAALSGTGAIFSRAVLVPAAASMARELPIGHGKVERRSPRTELTHAAHATAIIAHASPSAISQARITREGFDTPSTLSLSDVREIARQPVPDVTIHIANDAGQTTQVRVLEGLLRARPVLKLSHGARTYAAKFHADEKVAHHEDSVLDAITRAADRDGIAETLPGFRVQRAAPLKLLFTNDEGAFVPVILSEWITARPLSDILDAKDPAAIDPQKAHALYEQLKELERSDFWKGMSWLQEQGFALVDLQPCNVMFSFPEIAFTVFDFEAAVRRPHDPHDDWNQTRFQRASRIWQRTLRKWRDDLKEKLPFLRK